MPNPRNHLGYAALNGKAYAIGGQYLNNHDTGVQSEVDAYDPARDTWTAVAPLPLPTGHIHTSTFTLNGRVVVAGGDVAVEHLLEHRASRRWARAMRRRDLGHLLDQKRFVLVDGFEIIGKAGEEDVEALPGPRRRGR